jgi:glutathione synthase/RimK-type ligase-like ATP-grasp enzyme
MKELIILTDNDDKFLISVENLNNYTTMNVSKIEQYFTNKGFKVRILKFCNLDIEQSYNGKYVIYQTSEALNGFYKSYIEDLIFHLENQGAIALPKFDYLKAHHNKVYMEMKRYSFRDMSLKTITSKCYGSYQEAVSNIPNNYPVIIKQASGSGSTGVMLAKNADEYKRYVRKVSKVFYFKNIKSILKDNLKKLLALFIDKYNCKNICIAEQKFIVQNFIKGLAGDYKVLFYGGKYYLLYRENRDNDFRASGSGKLFEVQIQEQENLLNFARKLILEIDFPIIGMDIGFDGKNYHLIEFQMIHLGPYTLQASNYWHEYINGKWCRFEGKSNLEEEFSRSIFDFIESKAEV